MNKEYIIHHFINLYYKFFNDIDLANDDKEYIEHISISETLDIVCSFLNEYDKELYSKDLKTEEIVHEVLSNKSLWGEDLTQINEFENTVAKYYKDIHENGMTKALENF